VTNNASSRVLWHPFVERGGLLILADANYWSQVGWIHKFGEGFDFRHRKCPIWHSGKRPNGVNCAPDHPCCPEHKWEIPWGEFDDQARAWDVVGRCPDGKALILSRQIGGGHLIVTTVGGEKGLFSAEYLQKLWSATYALPKQKWLKLSVEMDAPRPGQNAIRDGLEDYEYLWLLRQALPKLKAAGKAKLLAEAEKALAVDERILMVDESRTPKFRYTSDPKVFLGARKDLGNLVERTQRAVAGGPMAKGRRAK